MMVNKIASRRRFSSREALAQSLGWAGKSSETWGEVVCIRNQKISLVAALPINPKRSPVKPGMTPSTGKTIS